MEAVQQVIEQHILNAARQVEDQLDDQLHRIETLDADDLDALRERRWVRLTQLFRRA